MVAAVAITNLEYTAADLRRLMSKERDGEVVRRLSALALVLEGHSRTAAAAQSGMDRQTLCDWVHRYNEGGVVDLLRKSGEFFVMKEDLDDQAEAANEGI
jgi:transposase